MKNLTNKLYVCTLLLTTLNLTTAPTRPANNTLPSAAKPAMPTKANNDSQKQTTSTGRQKFPKSNVTIENVMTALNNLKAPAEEIAVCNAAIDAKASRWKNMGAVFNAIDAYCDKNPAGIKRQQVIQATEALVAPTATTNTSTTLTQPNTSGSATTSDIKR